MTESDGLPLDLFGEPDIPGTAADPGVHQYLIVGVKGDPVRAAQRLRDPS